MSEIYEIQGIPVSAADYHNYLNLTSEAAKETWLNSLKVHRNKNSQDKGEHTGLSVDYYKLPIDNPTTEGVQPYVAECNDIIEALGMNYAQANVFKAIWRIAAAKNLGKHKKGNNSIYDAEKAVFFSDRVLKQEKANGNH